MSRRLHGLLASLALLTAPLACDDGSTDPPLGGGGEGGAPVGGSAQGGEPATGGAASGGASMGGAGGEGGGGGAPECPVNWVVALPELAASTLGYTAAMPGGDMVLAGQASQVEHFYDNTGFYSQPMVVRVTPTGQEVWREILPATNDANVAGVVVGADGTIYLAGSFSGQLTAGAVTLTSAGPDAFVLALSPDGVVQWAKQFGDSQAQWALHLAMSPGGDLVVGGYLEGTIDLGGGALSATLGPDIFLARLDADGDHIASRTISKAQYDDLWSLDVAADDRVLVGAAHTEDFMGADYVAAYSADLSSELWSTETNVSEPQVRARADGTLVVVGAYLTMRHLDEDGVELSEVTHDAGNFGLLYPGVAITPDGLACVTGSAVETVDLGTGPIVPDGDGDAVIACYDVDWTATFVTLIDGGTWSSVGRYLPLGPGSGLVGGQFEDGIDTCGGAATSEGRPDAFAAHLSF